MNDKDSPFTFIAPELFEKTMDKDQIGITYYIATSQL